jgi:ABC-type amino acid transport substrate-binding protein
MTWRSSAIAVLLLFTMSSRADSGASPKALTLVPGILRIGTYFVNPPFEYIFRGKKVGFEVDLIREIAHRLRLEPLFVNTQWEVILQQMQDGRYDCVIGGITITSARQATLAWSDPYMTTTLRF